MARFPKPPTPLTTAKYRMPEYRVWISMKNRTITTSHPTNAKYYKDRGIVVCDRWKNSFSNFLKDMGRRPSAKYTIERINNDGDYEPRNCRWATRLEQANNRSSNRRVMHKGEIKTISQWANEFGVTIQSIDYRLARWGKVDGHKSNVAKYMECKNCGMKSKYRRESLKFCSKSCGATYRSRNRLRDTKGRWPKIGELNG